MKPPSEAAAPTPPVPYIDEEGNRFLNVRQAAKIIGIAGGTLRTWATDGVPFNFELYPTREPMIHDSNGFRHEAKTHLEYRILLPEERVYALKEILDQCPRRPGPLSKADIDTLEAAAELFRVSLRRHVQNSPTL